MEKPWLIGLVIVLVAVKSQRRTTMRYYAGLDIGLDHTAVCVVDDAGRRVAEGKLPTEPKELLSWLRQQAPNYDCVGLEACPLSDWLYDELSAAGLKIVCLETHHLRSTLSAMTHKTDRNDARGIAQVIRVGWYKAVHPKSRHSRELRALLTGRQMAMRQALKLENAIRGMLKSFGIRLAKGRRDLFEQRVRTALHEETAMLAIVTPLLDARRGLLSTVEELHGQVLTIVKNDDVCRRLMTVPGVGAITALTFRMAVDDASRFKKSKAVGAIFGLVPRKYQSGHADRDGHITRAGDAMARSTLFEAANVLLTRVGSASRIRDWAQRLAMRAGKRKAKVALARKLAVILHRIWQDGTAFNPQHDGRIVVN
jgi:transposase